MNERKVYIQLVSDRGCALGSTGVGRDDDNTLLSLNFVSNILENRGLSVQIVYRNIKEALNLRCMEILFTDKSNVIIHVVCSVRKSDYHGDDVRCTRNSKHIGD